MSWRSATRLVARCTAPIWVRSPNFSTVAIRLTTTAAKSSKGLCRSGSEMSPMKNPKFSVAASTTKKPKTTFSRFIRTSRRDRRRDHDGRKGLAQEKGLRLGAAGDVDDLAGDEPGALADQERHRVRDVLRHPGAVDRDRRGPLGDVLVPVPADPRGGRLGHVGGD